MIYDLDRGTRRRGSGSANANIFAWRFGGLATALVLGAILLAGLGLRSMNLAGWDGRQFLHPDERFVAYAVSNLRLPHSVREYFDSTIAPLNPRNYDWSKMFVYGTLPTTITRMVAGLLGQTDANDLVVVGRMLSVFFDLVACSALFFLGRRLYGRGIGLLAAALYAFAVMPIQQAHFFTTDNFGVAFTTLVLVAAVRLGDEGRWQDALLAGICTGAAVACKVNLAALGAIVAVAALQSQLVALRARPVGAEQDARLLVPGWFRGLSLLVLAGLVTFFAFRVFQPDAFTGPYIWDIWPEPRFLDNLQTVRELVDGTVDMPPSHQWAARPPYLFALQNMIVWGMGLPLGIAAWAGFVATGYRMLVPRRREQSLRRRLRPLVPWVWVALYFAWQGRGFNPSLRYFLPIYPPLILFAAVLVAEIGAWLRARAARRVSSTAGAARRYLVAGLVPALLLAATSSWAWAFTRIYTRPHTRIAAGEWMLQNAPRGSTLTDEQWDDALPFTNGNDNGCNPFCLKETLPYAEDEPSKFLGSTQTSQSEAGQPGTPQFVDGLIGQLAKADYVVLSSGRVYTSVARLPHRFPATLRYYRSLFDGTLGFDLVADFHSFPTLFGLPIPDLSAEEQFTVYDHPRVLIFRRTERFSAEKARELIIGDMNWDEIYRISALTTSSAPTALRLRDDTWNILQRSDTRYLFADLVLSGIRVSRPVRLAADLVIWLMAVELLGLAAFGLIWKLQIPLPDRGILSARLIGLLCFALPPALLAATGRIGVSRTALGVWYGLMAGFGMRMLLAERGRIRLFIQAHRGRILTAQVLYAAAVVLGLAIRALDPGAGQAPPAFGIAGWVSLLRSPVLPPPDPLFAGGQLVTPYASVLPVATLARLVGISPTLSFNLALATLFGLLLSLVWAATVRVLADRPFGEAPRDRSVMGAFASRSALVPLLAALLMAAPGLLAGPKIGKLLGVLPIGMVREANAVALATAVLAAGILAVSRGFHRRPGGRASLPSRPASEGALVAIAAGLLALIRGQDRWAFVAVALPAVLLIWMRVSSQPPMRRLHSGIVAGSVVVAAIALAGRLTVVESGTTLQGTVGIAFRALLPVLALVLLGAVAYPIVVGPRLVDRAIGLGVGGALGGWALLGLMLNWPIWLVAAPSAIVLTWLVTESLRQGPAGRRASGVFVATLSAMLLFVLVDWTSAGRAAGDPDLEFGVALVLLVCSVGWSLPVLGGLLRSRGRRTSIFVAGLLVGVLLVSAGEMLRVADPVQAPQRPISPALRGALDVLASDANGAPVVATAPVERVPAVAETTGLQVLLAAPQAEGTLRAILRPSLDAVEAGRLRALAEIYGANAARAAAQLQSYALDYVLLGPDERALYGRQAGAALSQLASSGTLKSIYSRDGVVLYRITRPAGVPPYVAKPADLPVPPLKNGLLDRPLAELPVVDEYGWNRWATSSVPLALLLWLALFELVGLLAWPLCAQIFARSPDGGWSWSKLVGLLVWGYTIWLPVSLGWWAYRWPSLIVGALVLGFAGWLVAGRPLAWRALVIPSGGWKRARWDILRTETLYLVVFGIWTLVRAANPDLWHPWLGGEKPFEFGMLNAIVRSPVMPPPDPFFSGGELNYYYYGLFLVSLPIRATGIDPAIAFNLVVPILLALVACAASSLVRDLTGKWRWALLGALLVALIGPVGSAFSIGESRGLVVALGALRPGFAGWGSRLGDWFWGPSRIIPFTINEFPFFSYLFADLHPHMIVLPVTVLAVALALELGRTAERISRAALLLSALVLGTLAAANSWDAPSYGLVIGGALLGRAWRSRAPRRPLLRPLAGAAGLAVGLLAGGLLLFLPFFTHYQAMVGGIGRVRRPDNMLDFASIYGVGLYVSVTLLAGLAWIVSRRAASPLWRLAGRGGAIALPLLTMALLLGGAAFGRGAATPQHTGPAQSFLPGLPLILTALVGCGLLLALVAHLRDEEWLILWIITVGFLVALGIQIVFVRDHLAGGDWERMNTVFKFGLQTWTLLALGAAAAMPLVLRLLRRVGDLAVIPWSIMLLVLLFAGLTYPAVAMPSRLAMRFQDHPGLTLDGLAYMETARYEHDGKTIDMHWDAEAIRWLKQHLSGLPVVLQSELEFYRAYGVRIAASTGFPTVLGRLHEDEQRPSVGVIAREADVQMIYNTPDSAAALALLDQYHVDYVYVGAAERAYYDAVGLRKWDTMVGKTLDVAYENPGVKIYRVRAVRVAPPASAVAPSSVAPAPNVVDPALQSLEAAHQAHPENALAAFGLASRYIQDHRLEDAAKVLADAAPSNPGDVPLHQLLGDVEAQLGHADEAIAAWQAAVNAQPSAGNTAKLGTGLIQVGRYDEAEQVLRQAQQRDPRDPLIHFYLGNMAQKRKRPDDVALARREYQAYLDQAPQDSPYRATAEQALKDLGR